MIHVVLAGEGRNELGGWSDEPQFRAADPSPGVIEALLRRVQSDRWKVIDAVPWRSLRKLRVGKYGEAERRNILGLLLRARERGAHVVAFVRDRDCSEQRQQDVEQAIAEQPSGMRVVGGMAIEKLESWLRSLGGERGAEALKHPEVGLPESIDPKNTTSYVSVVTAADLEQIPDDATSLKSWIGRARAALGQGPGS